VARPTRQARRERREQQRADRERDNGAGGGRRPPTAAATAEADAPQPGRPEAEVQPAVKHRGGVIGFIGECIAELKKVEWPGQKQVITGTVVVIVACTIVGLYLWGVDQVIRPLIERLIA
jgi:preprotein translocase subunit SecE